MEYLIWKVYISVNETIIKYEDDICVGCGVKSETGEEFLTCMGYNEQEILSQPNPLDYNLVFDGEVRDRTMVAITQSFKDLSSVLC